MEKEYQRMNMPWENAYGYAQAVKKGDTVWMSGQLGHNENGKLLDGMEAQMVQTYANIKKLLTGFGMTMEDVVEEVLYVLDSGAAFEVRKRMGRIFYTELKNVASTMVLIEGLALPGQLVEIKIIARQ